MTKIDDLRTNATSLEKQARTMHGEAVNAMQHVTTYSQRHDFSHAQSEMGRATQLTNQAITLDKTAGQLAQQAEQLDRAASGLESQIEAIKNKIAEAERDANERHSRAVNRQREAQNAMISVGTYAKNGNENAAEREKQHAQALTGEAQGLEGEAMRAEQQLNGLRQQLHQLEDRHRQILHG